MSRIGKSPIVVPAAVKVNVSGKKISVQGPKGKLDMELPRRTSLKVEGDKIVVSRDGEDAEAKAMHGLGRALIDDLIVVSQTKGCKRLYWHTDKSNHTARRLYDRYVQEDGHVRYRLPL